MISLCIWMFFILASLLVVAWAVTFAARAVGSSRAKLRVAIVAVILIVAVNIFLNVVVALLPSGNQMSWILVVLAVLPLFASVLAAFCVMRRVFGLSFGRTFAPFGAYLLIGLIAYVGLLFGVIRPFLAVPYKMPTKSMEPTIQQGDHFSVNKLIEPRRWDCVAYRQDAPDGPKIYCKRLVGLPGEKVRFDQGNIYINDKAVNAPPVIAGRCHMPKDSSFAKMHYKDGETILLGNDEYFFIGDNVDRSNDSRLEGPSHRSSLIGVADLMYWPLNRFRIMR